MRIIATAAAISWNCLLLKMEVSSLLGRLFPLSHSSHFYHSALLEVSSIVVSVFCSWATFLLRKSFARCYSLAFTFAYCFLLFSSFLASYFFFS